MRLVGSCDTERDAGAIASALTEEGIGNAYEGFFDEEKKAQRYRIWVCEEDDLERALHCFEQFQKNPPVKAPPLRQQTFPRVLVRPPVPGRVPRLTQWVVLICAILFFFDQFQASKIIQEKGALSYQVGLTPIQRNLLFDFPSPMVKLDELLQQHPIKSFQEIDKWPSDVQAQFRAIESTPTWQGIIPFLRLTKAEASQVLWCEKIRQGEIWRVFTPALLHNDFLHILFNMGWVFILLKQMEARLARRKVIAFILLVGSVSNAMQYFVGGPYFLGFSGVVVGIVGFIWMRQRKAPWEGYPLHRGTILFFLLVIGAMGALEVAAFVLQEFSGKQLDIRIANTAHIAGGLMGMWLGRLSWFARSLG